MLAQSGNVGQGNIFILHDDGSTDVLSQNYVRGRIMVDKYGWNGWGGVGEGCVTTVRN